MRNKLEDRPIIPQTEDSAKVVAVITPGQEELRALLRLVASVKPLAPIGPGRFFSGHLAGVPVLLGWTSRGRAAIRGALNALFDRRKVSRILLLGVASGLTEGLSIGHLLVAREVRDPEGVVPSPDAGWVDRATDFPGTREAIFYSSDRVLISSAEKRACGRRLLDESESRVGAAIADLETADYARAAAEQGVPFAAVRVIRDPVEEDLPLDLNAFHDASGAFRRGSALLHMFLRPLSALHFLELRLKLRSCSRRLADAAVYLILSSATGSGPPPRGILSPGPLIPGG